MTAAGYGPPAVEARNEFLLADAKRAVEQLSPAGVAELLRWVKDRNMGG